MNLQPSGARRRMKNNDQSVWGFTARVVLLCVQMHSPEKTRHVVRLSRQYHRFPVGMRYLDDGERLTHRLEYDEGIGDGQSRAVRP